jgi:hypothetical protein
MLFLSMSLIAFAAPPANDNFANAIVLSGLTPAVSVFNTEATNEISEPADTGYRTVWYTYRPPVTGRLTLTASNNNNFVITSTVYLGVNFSTLRMVAGSSAYISSTTRTFTFPVAANTDYRICIGSYSDQPQFSGLIQLGLSLDSLADVSYLNVPYAATTANDAFAQRSVLSGSIVGNSVSSIGYNLSATNEVAASEPTVAGSKTVWWTYRPSQTGRLTISTVGSDGFYSNIIVYLGDSLATLRNIAGRSGTGPTTFAIPVTANTDYHISVGGGDALNNSGSIVLSCLLDNQADVAYYSIPNPATARNDIFVNRAMLPGGTVSAIGYNTAAAREPLEAAGTGERTIWWEWTAPAAGTTVIDLTGSDAISKKVSVWRGAGISSLTQVAVSTQSNAPTLTFTATAGETYHIAVANNSSSSSGGSVLLTIGGPSGPPGSNLPNVVVDKAIHLRWFATNGLKYQVQRSPDLSTWTNVGSLIVGNGTFRDFFEGIDSQSYYYRIFLQQ